VRGDTTTILMVLLVMLYIWAREPAPIALALANIPLGWTLIGWIAVFL
jgi:hypothetical protein